MAVMDGIPDNWLDVAASHGATSWVKLFIRSFLPQLKDGLISAEGFADALEEKLLARGLAKPAQQKNYRSNVVQAIKSIWPEHAAIARVAPTTEQYRVLNEMQRGRLADRETRFFTSAQAEVLVERAIALLKSAEWSEVGAGLAVLIGRRISEVLLSEFSLRSAWSLSFGRMAKRRGELGLVIEVPTLARAEGVLGAIERLQGTLQVEDLRRMSLSSRLAKQGVNRRFSGPVAVRCEEHFGDLIPVRSDREGLYTHVFRAVYATIAAHWFCPPSVPEHSFKAEIQGHFTLTADGRKLPNYSARANYDDYAIGSEDGNRDGRLGIKLGKLPGLVVIEAFRRDEEKVDRQGGRDLASEKAEVEGLPGLWAEGQGLMVEVRSEDARMRKLSGQGKMRRPEVRAEDLERMVALMARRGIVGSVGEVFHELLEVFEAGELEREQGQVQTVSDLTASLSWFTGRIDALEGECRALRGECDRLKEAEDQDRGEEVEEVDDEELVRLRAENEGLRRELAETRSRLGAIQRLLGMGEESSPSMRVLDSVGEDVGTISNEEGEGGAIATKTPVRRGRGETEERLNQIVDALLAWNMEQERSDRRLRISIPAIKGLASAMGANYQKVIQEVIRERADELEEHHGRLMIGVRHNAGVIQKDQILQDVARDFLGLDNWGEVTY